MKNFILSLAALTVVSTLSACGGADNVGACNRWKTAVACGSTSNAAISAINCEAYSATTCDISAYFDCLSTAYVCKDGQYDSTKLANASTCASKAVCQ